MKNQYWLILLLSLIYSCSEKKEKALEDLEREAKIQIMARKYADSSMMALTKNRILDSTGMKDSPVKIIKAYFTTESYSNYKNISLKYKNVSAKPIQAIRFEWYGENSFGEPADMGGVVNKGEGGGFTDEIINPGKTGHGTWNIYSKDGKKILMARAYEVAFTDGTKWNLKSK